MRKPFISILLCCLWLWPAAAVLADDDDGLLDPEIAFVLSSAVKNAETLAFTWSIADSHYLYRHKFKFASKTAGIEAGAPLFPKGEAKKDKFFGQVEIYRGKVTVELPLRRLDAAAKHLLIDLSYQGCAEARVCYLPVRKALAFDLPEADRAGAGIPAPSDGIFPGFGEPDRIAAELSAHPLGLTLVSFFGFGLLLAFTPCVFPMIPIISGIVIGDRGKPNTRRAFALSSCYVLASALTYAIFGVLAGLFGQNLQAFFQQSWILVGTSVLFVFLALSMFGLFTLQMPVFLQSRLASFSSRQRQGNWLGAIFMGMLSALTVSPCVTAPLAGALIYIGRSGDALLGGCALFALGLGMGLPLLLIGTSAGKWLPRAGAWLHATKIVFGIGLLAVSLWLLGRILPTSAMPALWGVLFMVPFLYLARQKLWKPFGVLGLLYAIVLTAGIVTRSQRDYLGLLCTAAVACQAEPLPFQQVETVADLEQRLVEAKRKGQWLMLDFHADWCITCLEMQNTTFADPTVRAALSALTLVQVDVTEAGEAARALLGSFGLIGPPAVLFFDPHQGERKEFRIVGYMESEAFLAQIKRLAG